MLRVALGTVAVLSLCVAVVLAADDKKKDTKDAKADKPAKATITKVDAKNGTITVRMKNNEGKDVEKTFKLTEDIRYFDSTGKAAAIDVFQSGNDVSVIEREGKLKEMHKDRNAKAGEKGTTEKKPEEKKPEKK